jgi:NAD(P)-dependent dehydrogenase (short-subunit alcohol dehydrogenase family)
VSSLSVITGGGGGMGLATAKLVGRERRVLLCDVQEERLERAAAELRASGVDCDVVVCDVADRRSVHDLVARATSSGPVASVVHTAGLSPQMATADRIMRVNALGTLNLNEAFLEVAPEGSSIVNVASTAGHLPAALPLPRRTYERALTDRDRFLAGMVSRCNLLPERFRPAIAYSLSKNFVIWYSRKRAGAFGAKGARIVSVSPGVFDTEMGRLEVKSGAGELAKYAAIKRFGRVEEIAEVLAFCASERPGYLTGTDILVDGGAAATMTRKDARAMAKHL